MEFFEQGTEEEERALEEHALRVLEELRQERIAKWSPIIGGKLCRLIGYVPDQKFRIPKRG